MKRYLPLLGIFFLFLLVVSGFARAEAFQNNHKTERDPAVVTQFAWQVQAVDRN